MLICTIVGARPNFMKMAPVVHELTARGMDQKLIHTGQHYDENMSKVFFRDLGIPEPDIYLNTKPDTQVRQTAAIMNAFETVCSEHEFDLILVGGDVTSTFSAAYVGAKLYIPVGHVESGLRSFDMAMPEEVNRILTDHISDLLFTTEEDGNLNLKNEGVDSNKVHFVGNCMVDTLLKFVDAAKQGKPWEEYDLRPGGYALMTLHRPSNVDDRIVLERLLQTIGDASANTPVVFPVHPRTRQRMEEWKLDVPDSIILVEPLPYLKFTGLMSSAKFVLTDSGGIQEETTVLSIPCVTLRENTERPVTVKLGSNRIVGTDSAKITGAVEEILSGEWELGNVPPLWDGKAATRIVDVIESW